MKLTSTTNLRFPIVVWGSRKYKQKVEMLLKTHQTLGTEMQSLAVGWIHMWWNDIVKTKSLSQNMYEVCKFQILKLINYKKIYSDPYWSTQYLLLNVFREVLVLFQDLTQYGIYFTLKRLHKWQHYCREIIIEGSAKLDKEWPLCCGAWKKTQLISIIESSISKVKVWFMSVSFQIFF